VLPHVLGYNGPAAPGAASRIAGALRSAGFGDGKDALGGLLALYAALSAPTSLGDLGLAGDQVGTAAALALAKIPPSNPRPVSCEDLVALLARAQAGAYPIEVPAPPRP